MQLIRRNVCVARRSIESCKQEREEAKRKRDRLESRKQYLQESLRKAKERERTLLQNLQTVEREQSTMRRATSDEKQRGLLKHALTVKNDTGLSQVMAQVDSIRTLTTLSEPAKHQHALEGGESPIDVLLKEYLHILKASDRPAGHLRGYGSDDLMRWLAESLARVCHTSFQDAKDREYVARVEEHTNSSREALAQVQALLRTSQKEHITRFLATQTAYLKARQRQDMVDKELAVAGKAFGRAKTCDGVKIEPTTGIDKAYLTDTVELEIEKAAQSAALAVASRTLAKLREQVQASKQQKRNLDEKVELMTTFSRRQQEVLARINAMRLQNDSLICSIVEKQGKLQLFAAENLILKHRGRSGELVQNGHQLMLDELRVFTGIRLENLDKAVKSPRMMSGDRHGAEAIRRNQQVPYSAFYINQVKLHDGNNGFARVFRALGVPSYGNWSRLLAQMDMHSQNEAFAVLNHWGRQLEQEIAEEQGRTHPSTFSRVGELLTDLRSLAQSMETGCFPRLEEVMAVNGDTYTHILPRLRTLIDDWYSQSGWLVHTTREEQRVRRLEPME
ncbi:hypothetical protein BBJ28_00019358 [Nothophytophthora sp. Chile5]|nr:hypothetical protein BBJ28_00019358 [Nothophytophthora sp. Chile5]